MGWVSFLYIILERGLEIFPASLVVLDPKSISFPLTRLRVNLLNLGIFILIEAIMLEPRECIHIGSGFEVEP